MLKARAAVIIIVSAILAAGLFIEAGLEQPHVLVVECDGVVTVFPLDGRVYVIYNWTHSVEGSMISEKMLASPWGLVLVEARAKSFGAGHPYNSEEIGGSGVRYVNGMIVYSAWQPLGDNLTILAPEDYRGNVTVVWNGIRYLVCPDFRMGMIRISP